MKISDSEISEGTSWMRNHGGDIMERGIMEEASGGGIMDEESWRGHHGGRHHGGGIWRKHLEEASWRRHLEPRALYQHRQELPFMLICIFSHSDWFKYARARRFTLPTAITCPITRWLQPASPSVGMGRPIPFPCALPQLLEATEDSDSVSGRMAARAASSRSGGTGVGATPTSAVTLGAAGSSRSIVGASSQKHL